MEIKNSNSSNQSPESILFMLEGPPENLKLVPMSPFQCTEEKKFIEKEFKIKPQRFRVRKSDIKRNSTKRENNSLNLTKQSNSTCDSSDTVRQNTKNRKSRFVFKENNDKFDSTSRVKKPFNSKILNLRASSFKDKESTKQIEELEATKKKLDKISEINSMIKHGKFVRKQMIDIENEEVMNENIRYLDVNDLNLQKHFMKICDIKGQTIRNCILTSNGFKEYIKKRYCFNIVNRLIYIMEFPNRARFHTYVECCNNLIRLSHFEKIKLCFGFYDHDYDEKISVTDGLLMMKHLTENDILVQEDLKLIIEAITKKQKNANKKHNINRFSKFGNGLKINSFKIQINANQIDLTDNVNRQSIYCADDSNTIICPTLRSSIETRKMLSTPATNEIHEILKNYNDKELINISDFDISSAHETTTRNRENGLFKNTEL